jgi:hypothetical protein
VFILKHYFGLLLFVAVHEAFSNAYPNKEVPNKTICQLLTNFWDTRIFACDKYSSSNKAAEIMAVLISNSASAATVGYGCENSVLPLIT